MAGQAETGLYSLGCTKRRHKKYKLFNSQFVDGFIFK